jgi:hypothetical protein
MLLVWILLHLSLHEMKEQVYTCYPSTWKGNAGGLWVQGQPGLHKQDPVSKQTKKDVEMKAILK